MFNLFLNILSIFTIASFLCFGILLFIKKTNHIRANRLLALIFFAYSVGQLQLFLFNTKLIYSFTFMLNIDFIVITIHSTVFYLFVCEMTGLRTRYDRRLVFLLLPILVPVCHWLIFLFVYDTPDKVKHYIDDALIKIPLNVTLINTYFTIINIIYLFLSYRRVKEYSIQIKQYVSNIHKINLQWLKQVTMFFLLAFITIPVFLILMQNMYLNCLFGQIVFTVFYLFLFFRTIHESAVFSDVSFAVEPKEVVATSKYAKSIIKGEDIQIMYQKVKSFMDQEEIYLNPNITLKELSDKTGIGIHALSQVINQEFKMNFFELINSYRVEKAKSLLTNEKLLHHSIESIGYDSGFGTKSSFFSVFKKFTSQTPLEFRKNSTRT